MYTIDFDKMNRELQQKGFDLDSIVDHTGKPIEDKIKPLVLVLNYLGYETIGSCEGHNNADGAIYKPYVELIHRNSDTYLEQLFNWRKITADFSGLGDHAAWSDFPISPIIKIRAVNGPELSRMQASIIPLAEFIYRVHQDDPGRWQILSNPAGRN